MCSAGCRASPARHRHRQAPNRVLPKTSDRSRPNPGVVGSIPTELLTLVRYPGGEASRPRWQWALAAARSDGFVALCVAANLRRGLKGGKRANVLGQSADANVARVQVEDTYRKRYEQPTGQQDADHRLSRHNLRGPAPESTAGLRQRRLRASLNSLVGQRPPPAG